MLNHIVKCLRILPCSQLQATHEASKKELQAVQDNIYAKDGEVSTIRRSMTKVPISFPSVWTYQVPLTEL
jgi:hypothetical protein